MNKRRYIGIDTDDQDREFWTLTIGNHRALTVARTTIDPPIEITAGLPFEPQYDCHESHVEGEPCGWVYRPRRAPLFDRVPQRVWWFAAAFSFVFILRYPVAAAPCLIAVALAMTADIRRRTREFDRVLAPTARKASNRG